MLDSSSRRGSSRPYKAPAVHGLLEQVLKAQMEPKMDPGVNMAAVYDYIIVGGGTAGLVVAARLSEDPSVSVLVIEAGKDRSDETQVNTPALWPTMMDTQNDWCYRTRPQFALENREIVLPQGLMLGGCSAFNGLSWLPAAESTINAWAQLGNPGWEWEHMSKYFRRCYTMNQPADPTPECMQLDYVRERTRSTGPLQLSVSPECSNVWAAAWLQSLTALGFPRRGNPLDGSVQGGYVGPETVHPNTVQRSYAVTAYLDPIRNRPNLLVLPGKLVQKIVLDDSAGRGRPVARAVQWLSSGITRTTKCRREVILTAGTYNTARLLELSGIGDEDRLERIGIKPMVHNQGVGANLQNRPSCTVSFEVADNAELPDAAFGMDPDTHDKAADRHRLWQTGPLAHGETLASAQLPLRELLRPGVTKALDAKFSYRTDPTDSNGRHVYANARSAHVQSMVTSPKHASASIFCFAGHSPCLGDGSRVRVSRRMSRYLSVTVQLAHPLSSGTSHIASDDVGARLQIDPRYLTEDVDCELLARHVLFVDNQLAAQQPLANLLKPDGFRSTGLRRPLKDLKAAETFVRRTAVAAHDSCGTCSMMPRDIGGVVDPELRVYGVDGLRVCDASVIPIIPAGGLQATVYAVAEHAAALIKTGMRDGCSNLETIHE